MVGSLSSPGIGSGLDVQSIVSKLISVEQQPLANLDTRAVELRAQVSAYGKLKSTLSTFKDAIAKLNDSSKFKVFAATSTDEGLLSASASSSAAGGTYSILVNRVAENHRLASNVAFASADGTTIGNSGDSMTISIGGNAFTVDAGGKTLAQIRDAVNGATANTGVTASLIKDNAGYRLLLAANDTGSAKAVTVSYSGADPFSLQTLNADRNGDGVFTAADLDASLTLEGRFSVTSSSNSVSDLIQGVTLTLKKAGTVTVNVNRDTDSVKKSVGDFAKAYSDLVATINKLRGEALKTDSSSLLDIESQFRGVLNSSVNVGGSFRLAFEVGISTQKDGSLSVNDSVLQKALASDYNGVAALFADPDRGVAVRLSQLADSFLSTNSIIDARSQSLDRQVRDIDEQRTQMQRRLALLQERYTKQFSALDALVAQLQSTGNFLSQQLQTVSSNGRSGR